MSILLLIWNKIKNIPIQPCCGYFLHGGTRVIGLLDFGLSVFASFFIGSEIYQHFNKLQILYQQKEIFKYYLRAASWASYFTYQTILLGFSILLFKAAKKRSSKLCKIWMVCSILINAAMISTYYFNRFLYHISSAADIFILFYLIYKFYCLHVVWSFVKEIESYGGFNAALSGLTDAEVEEFEQGCPPELQNNGSDITIEKQGFNKDFEIRTENLDIDQSSILGSGAFGCVYRGKLTTESGTKPVAVKTVNPNADVTYFKTLLSELKVMTYVSHNENVVSLIGACTANIKEKKLCIVVEFCPYGNLHEYLKARRGLFTNFVKNGELRCDFGSMGGYANLTSGNTVTTLDLFKWIYDTSKGLEFLEQNKVIHGDIAARNILLAYGKIAKISDFGLAKRLYQYTTVVKEDILLPWRWMALESLTDMEFSLKSDVWSFATAMWEAFSLSELPFPGFTWDKYFVTKVSNGLRMNQPRNASNDVYELMVKCWQPNPDDRPTFKEVRIALERILNHASSIISDNQSQQMNPSRINNRTMEGAEIEDEEIEMYIPNQVITDSLKHDV